MVKYLHTNNAGSTLRDAITATSTIVRVAAGHGTLFPNPGTDEAFFVTVEDRRAGRLEIMLCTQRSTDTFTVVRGQQGTVPQSFSVGVSVANRVTATVLNDFVEATVDVIPIERIPTIPDAKISSLNASKINVGTLNAARLPAIPAANLTSVPAVNLTGLVPLASIPTLTTDKIPTLPDSKITSLTATKLTGLIALANIPLLPSDKIDSLSASKLTGTLPTTLFNAPTYTFSNIVTDLINAARIYVNPGTQGAPGYCFDGAFDTGMYLTGTGTVGIVVDGVIRMQVSDTIIHAHSGMSFSGSGESLTNITSTSLPQPGSSTNSTNERTRIMEHIAAAGTSVSGVYAMMELDPFEPSKNFGDTVPGNKLKPAAANGLNQNAPRPSTEVWRCQGYTPGSEDEDYNGQRVTLWKRVS